jgi:hypothetical protein
MTNDTTNSGNTNAYHRKLGSHNFVMKNQIPGGSDSNHDGNFNITDEEAA